MGYLLSLLGDPLAHAETKKGLSSDFLGFAGTPTPTPASSSPNGTFKNKNQNRSHSILDEKSADLTKLKESAETITSISVLLRRLPPGASRNQMLMNHGAALNLYARQLLLASKSAVITDDVKRYLEASIKDANEILASPVITPEQRWKAFDLKGSSYLYLDQSVPAFEAFSEVLKLNPPPERAGRIGLLIAEDLFDKAKFKEASTYYLTYLPKMSARWKELATYKLGWCMINLDQFEKAEKYLASVARSQSVSGVGKDAMRDLAYLVTHHDDVLGTVQHAETNLIPPEERLAFLTEVRPNLEASGLPDQHTIIVERLLSLEKSPEKRIEFLMADLRVQRKLNASRTHMTAFRKVRDELEKTPPKLRGGIFAKFDSAIENELQSLMKAFLDTFAGRVKTGEAYPREEIGTAMKEQFNFYHRWFSKKKNYPLVVTLWSDVCLDMKDWHCVDSVSEIIIANPKGLPLLTERAYLDEIAALDQFLSTETKSPQLAKWKDRRFKRLQEFTGAFPKSGKWVPVAKFYSQAEMDVGNMKAAKPVLDRIMLQEPQDENFYRLQFARFTLKEYDTVLGDSRGQAYIDHGSKVVELYRESALALARMAKDKKDVEKYRANLIRFAGYSKDPEKTSIARIDFLQYLTSMKSWQEAVREVLALPPNEASLPQYEAFRTDLWKSLIDEESFVLAMTLATRQSELPNAAAPGWKQKKILNRLFSGSSPTASDLETAPQAEREYYLSLLAITRPSDAIALLIPRTKRLSDGEKSILNLAYRNQLDQPQLIRSPELESLFGKTYPFVERAGGPDEPVETAIASIRFPDLSKLAPEKQGAQVKSVMDSVHSIRGRIAKSIKGKSPSIQIRILNRASDLETRTADLLLNSPIPKELAPEQIEAYKKGIGEAAEEFKQQAEQFQVLIRGIDDAGKKSQEKLEARIIPIPSMDGWPWPDGLKKNLTPVGSALKAGKPIAALALLDYYRGTSVKEDQDYFFFRAGIILASKPNSALRSYLLDELEKSEQSKVIETWSRLAKKPAPEVKK